MEARANLVFCKWVKQQGPAKGLDFNEGKVEQIFNLLLREKQLKLPKGDHISSGISYSRTPPMTAKSSVGKFNWLLSRAD
jgi:hypothetical protein